MSSYQPKHERKHNPGDVAFALMVMMNFLAGAAVIIAVVKYVFT